ncbi:MAG: VCBS repeat-containing protein [Candidatus Eisenbacteria bacterium]|nr:VCBS repeat-containing protein [Candidatus Eisenbacteria bacterium]
MITMIVLALVVVGLTLVLYSASHNKVTVANRLESAQQARVALDMMAHDIRIAGYGTDAVSLPAQPQPAIAYVDSLQILINANLNGDLATIDTLAYDPDGNPKPAPLDGTSWEPPAKYKTGAEIVRWTLDVNNDGLVDTADQTSVEGADANRTPNPNDYVLARQIYADSLNDVAGDNGGAIEHVALLQRPGGSVPPLFTVYMKGSATAWDWSNGPVPAIQLANIERIVIKVSAGSTKPDKDGKYAATTLETSVNSMRNTPSFGDPEYAVDGYVFNDTNKNHLKDGGEAGIPGTAVLLGQLSNFTDLTGHFYLRAPVGTYVLKHYPASGYGDYASPDSFTIALNAPVSHNFADTAKAGGWVKCVAYSDLNGNGAMDGSDTLMANVKMTLNPGNAVGYTNYTGSVPLFASTGSYNVTVTAPDSFAVTSANPVTKTMSTGGSDSVYFGLSKSFVGTVKGNVFRDNNKNGTLDAGENGIQNVWVGISPDGGVTVEGYAYTDASGNYSITCPINDPPKTQPYYAMVVPPNGFFPTSTTAIGPFWLQNGQIISSQNFGMGTFTVITLNAQRVLSLASANLIEKDWPGNATSHAVGDVDLVLGADAGATDNISVWFNQYNSSPTFNTSPDYTRLAPQSVLSMALDTLDTNGDKLRPDLATGTKYSAAYNGNFFVWLCQDNPNEGYFPSSYSTGKNYKTADLGDVQAILAFDCAGGASADKLDLIVGTKSPTAGLGTFEVWKSDNAATPTWTLDETYPVAGSIPGNSLGEVTCMALGDLNGDGRKDLVVGTRTGSYSGQVMVFKNVSKTTGNRFIYQFSITLALEAATCLTITDINGDGNLDIVAGTQNGVAGGKLDYFKNATVAGSFAFVLGRQIDAPGIPLSLISADLGGSSRGDLVLGYRADASSYGGGIRIYFTDSGTLPPTGTDPSSGSIVNMVPALNSNNFNYGIYPSTPAPPYLLDIAAGVKNSATTGALVVFIR